MNISEILKRKAGYPVRLIATDRKEFDFTKDNPFILYEIGDEVGIEAIDFSACNLRVCNKSEIRNGIFDISYDRETGEVIGGWEFKP
ncbi:MAG: hypothetical protein K9J84_10610 [Bacteroidia bacterium]|nr:hypothetical protein [Bacteroidia bacterium]